MLFSLIFIFLIAYMVIGLVCDVAKLEMGFLKWFNRTFGFCKHDVGYQYNVEHYLIECDLAPSVVYAVKCGLCGKKIARYQVYTQDIIDTKLSTVQSSEWLDLNIDEYKIIKEVGIPL